MGETPPPLQSCVLVTAPTNAQVNNLLSWVPEECHDVPVCCEKLPGDHLAPWLQLRAQLAAFPLALASFDQRKVQVTLGSTPTGNPTFTCAANSCPMVFAAAGMVANQRRLLLGAAPVRPQTRFGFNFVDEASRNSILVGLDLASIGNQCLLWGGPGQLRPYSHVNLLAAACSGNPQAKDVAWRTQQTFSYHNVCMPSASPHVHRHDSQRFCTTSTLQFFLYRTRCRSSILV